jgi:hypothetical protein
MVIGGYEPKAHCQRGQHVTSQSIRAHVVDAPRWSAHGVVAQDASATPLWCAPRLGPDCQALALDIHAHGGDRSAS